MRAESLREAFGVRTVAAAADVTDPGAVDAAFATARHRIGPPDILINNAGAAKSAPFARTDADLWHEMLNVNLTGVYLCTRAALPDMTSAGFGRIVNVASTAGLKGYAYVTAYCAAKHGVIGLTRALALETAGTGVTVNAVCPGYTDTDMVRASAKSIAAKTGRSEEAARAASTRPNRARDRKPCTTVAPPTAVEAYEAGEAIGAGAKELDMVMAVGLLKSRQPGAANRLTLCVVKYAQGASCLLCHESQPSYRHLDLVRCHHIGAVRDANCFGLQVTLGLVDPLLYREMRLNSVNTALAVDARHR